MKKTDPKVRFASTLLAGQLCEPVLENLVRQGDVLQAALPQLKFLKHLQKVWLSVCGPLLCKHLKPLGIRGNVLLVSVAHPIWAEQAKIYQEQLLQRLAKAIPWLEISKLRFSVDSQPRIAQEIRFSRQNPVNGFLPSPRFEQTKARLERLLQVAPKQPF